MPTTKYFSTRWANLVRSQSGTYFIRASVHGEKVFRSLRTKSSEIAVLRLPEELKKEREKPRLNPGDDARICDLMEIYIDQTKLRTDIRDNTRRSIGFSLNQWKRACPDSMLRMVSTVTENDCKEWFKAATEKYCAANANKLLGILRRTLDMAVQRGVLTSNPAQGIKCVPVPTRERKLPSGAELALFFAALKQSKRGGAYYLAKFLCYSGFRVGTSRLMTPANVNRESGFFEIPGEWLKTGTVGKIYRFPIMPQMATLLDELDQTFGKSRERLLPVASGINTMKRRAAELGIPPTNHHTFRHIFSTHCIAAGVPVPIIAEWRGDRDGGKTLLRIYHHLLDDTSKRYAAKIHLP